ncbi:Trypsin, partial [Lachnellula suecica]
HAGSNIWNAGGDTRQIKQAIIHPDYDNVSQDYDIAVIILDEPFELGATIGSIKLVGSGEEPADGTDTTVIGWGFTQSDRTVLPEALQEVTIPVISRTTCEDAYGSLFTAHMFCAGLANGSMDSCGGDSGGPSFNRVDGEFQLLGVTSWGLECASDDYPAVFVDLANADVASWVRANANI